MPVFSEEHLARVLGLIDACLEGGWCVAEPARLWDVVAERLDGEVSSEVLASFFENWDGAGVDVDAVVAGERYERSNGALLNIDLDMSAYQELAFEAQEEDDEEEEEAAGTGTGLNASHLSFPVRRVARDLPILASLAPAGAPAADGAEDMGPQAEGELAASPAAAVFTSAVLEYLAAELLELAGIQAIGARRSCIHTCDLDRAIAADEHLRALRAAVPLVVEPTIPKVLLPQESAAGHLWRVDAYWRTGTRFPGGNCDSFTLRYRFDLGPHPDAVGSVSLTFHRNWDGAHYGGGGDLPAARDRAVASSFALELRTMLRVLVASGLCQEGRCAWHVWDHEAVDSNAYDTEWSSVEILVYDGDGGARPGRPFLSLLQARVLGPQFRPQPAYQPRVTPAAPEQRGVVHLATQVVGMGRPQSFSDGTCPAAVEARAVSQVQYPPGLPNVLPEYFRY